MGGHHVLIAVVFAQASPGIDLLGGEEAGAVEVEVGGEHILGEVVDLCGEAAGDLAVAEVFAHDGGVFTFHQGIVVGVSGTGLGELTDMELVEQPGDLAVDVLRAVVGVEGQDGEGEALEEGFEYRQQEAFGDALDRADELELGDRIDEVDVVEPLDAVQIPLMDRIDPQEAGLPERFPARQTMHLKRKAKNASDESKAIAWRAQKRLCGRYRTLLQAGKNTKQTTVAIARELVGFIWDIACHEMPKVQQAAR